jgi:glycosyltransferase involved in cell wall biosynthesis
MNSQPPLSVLHFFHAIRAELGGPARAIVDLCSALAARGHRATLATSDDRDVPASWPRDGLKPGVPSVVLLPDKKSDGRSLGAASKAILASQIAQHQALHIHGVWEWSNQQAARLARRAGTPYFLSVRGMLDDWSMAQGALKKRVFLALTGRRTLEQAAAVHLTAQFELDQARKHFPRGRGVVVPNLTDLAPYQNLPGPGPARARFPFLADGTPTLLFLSRIHVKKGLDPLLRAAAMLKRAGVPFKLVIAGTGDDAHTSAMQGLARELGLAEVVHFVGLVVNQEKVSLYESADLFVLPTSQENFGFVFIEALACGTPVVTTKGVDIWPELESSGGATITSADPAELSGVLQRLLAQRDALPAMGARGREWVFRELTPDRVLDRFELLYRSGLGGSGPAR